VSTPERSQERRGSGRRVDGAWLPRGSGGTDNHLILVDLTTRTSWKGRSQALDKGGIELNYTLCLDTRKRSIPLDPPRLALVTSRAWPAEMKQIAVWMDRVMANPSDENAAQVAAEVRELTKRFPRLESR